MTYLSDEISTHDGKPSELFRFVGTYATYRYTSGQAIVSFQADDEAEEFDYIPIAIRRSAVNAGTQEDDGLDITVQMSVQQDIVQTYGFSTPPPELNLTIFRFHSDSADFVQYWTGPVANIRVDDGIATLQSPSRFANALGSEFPNVYYQVPCNHILFDPYCGIDRDLWKVNTTISAVSGSNVTVASVGALTGLLIGGEIVLVISGERRMIVEQTGTVIRVNFPFSQTDIGEAVELAPGCDNIYTGGCVLFDNQINFGGFPFFTEDNPFMTGIEPPPALADDTCLVESYEGWMMKVRLEYLNPNVSSPNLGYGCEPDGLYTIHNGSPAPGKVSVAFEYIEFTWYLGGGIGSEEVNETSFNDPIHWYIYMQWIGGPEGPGATMRARIRYRRPSEGWSIAVPVSPSDEMEAGEGNGWFDIYGTFPVNQHFNF